MSRPAVVLVLALALTPFTARDLHAATPERFWDVWAKAGDFVPGATDSALALAAARLALDSQDLLGHAVRAMVASEDSVAADSMSQRASATGEPGAQVEIGVMHLSRGRSAEGRAALTRARDGYAARGRDSDAGHAMLLQALLDRRSRTLDDPALVEAESLAVRAGDTELLVQTLATRGGRLMRRDVEAAARMVERATRLGASLGACHATTEAERQLGIIYKSQGRLDSARVHYARAEVLARELGRPALHARTLHGLATTYEAEGRLLEAETMYRSALALTPASERSLRANLLGQMGSVYIGMKRYDDARAVLQESSALFEQFDRDAENRVLNLDRLAGIEALTGNLEAARETFEAALAESRRLGLRFREGPILMHFAEYHLDLGDDERAAALLEEGLRLERASGRGRLAGVMLSLKADVHLRRGEYEAALALAHEAVALLRRADPAGVPSVNRQETRALIALGRLDQALAVTDSSRRFAESREDTVLLVQAWNLEGEVRAARGETDRALELFDRALAQARRIAAPDLLIGLQERRGRTLLEAGRWVEAAATLEDAIDMNEQWRATVASSEERGQFQSLWQDVYVDLAIAYVRAGRNADAFRVLDRSRARELRERFGADAPAPSRDVPRDLLREEREASAALEEAQRQMVAQYALPAGQRTASLPALESRCRRLRARAAEVAVRVERAAPTYARESGIARPVSVAEVRARLGADATLLAYLIGPGGGVVFVASRDRLTARPLALGEAELEKRVGALVDAIEHGREVANDPLASALADSLIPPEALNGRGRLAICPDGPLNVLPFEALRVREQGERRWLVERHVVFYAPSPGLLLATGGRGGKTTGGMAVFGDPAVAGGSTQLRRGSEGGGLAFEVGPLPHARREAVGIAARFPGARSYLGGEATEGHALEELERAAILHLAAHAFVDPRHPRFSGLVLARAANGSGDGLLQAFEVMAHRGTLDLVTLSACETGLGKIQRGEGLLGLARAFRIAGARNLVVSLWKVDDAAAADFMLSFYDRIARGERPAEALAATKRAMLAGPAATAEPGRARGVSRTSLALAHRHPAHWAAFVLHGSAGQ